MLTRCAPIAALFSASICAAQHNTASLRFYGTGVGPPGQQDRVRIRIDDNVPGPDASTVLDLGAGSFSIDFWLRGRLADNNTPHAGGDMEFFDNRWINGNILFDRDIWGASSRDWGISIAGGHIRFGTGHADTIPNDGEHTLEGSTNVLDDQWHHVTVVRHAPTGRKLLYVDGILDFASAPGRSSDDISYPDEGDPSPVTPWGPFIVLAAEKHDAGTEYPSFAGYVDEVRFWSIALSATQVADWHARILPSGTPGLVACYRFEEGTGTSVASTVPAPTGQLIAGVPGNGEWALASTNPLNVAPVTPFSVICDSIDFNNDGLFPDTADIDDYLSVFSGGPCSTAPAPGCNDIDFNNDGLFPDTLDIDSLLSVFGGGPCL